VKSPLSICAVGTRLGSLVSAEEKQLILFDGPAHGSAVLVAFESVARGGKKVSGIQNAVADKLESVAVKLIRAGLDHSVDRGPGVHAVLGGQSAGLHLEFLQRIGERQRQVEVVVRIIMHRPIEHVRGSERCSARDGKSFAAGLSLPGPAGRQAGLDDRSGQYHEIGGIPPIQRELEDALVINYRSDAGGLRFHHGGVGFYLNLFCDGADLQRDIDGGIVTHLQDDAGLKVPAEALLARFQLVWPDRQIRQNVFANSSRGCCTHEAGAGLGGLNVDSGHGQPGGIPNSACDLSGRYGLRPSRSREASEKQDSDHT
jgi:hypothetical protein